MRKLWEKISYKSALRVALVLLVAFFIAIKFPEGVKVACSMADVLAVKVEACGRMQ